MIGARFCCYRVPAFDAGVCLTEYPHLAVALTCIVSLSQAYAPSDDVDVTQQHHSRVSKITGPSQGYEPNSFLLSFLLTYLEQLLVIFLFLMVRTYLVWKRVRQELSLADLTYIWTPGHGSDRSMGRPKENPRDSMTSHSRSRIVCRDCLGMQKGSDRVGNAGTTREDL